MALAFGLPLFGVSTLDATAFPQLGRPEPVCAVVAAGRERLCWSTYWPQDSELTHRPANCQPVTIGQWTGWRTPVALSDVRQLAAEMQVPTWIAGELTSGLSRQLNELLGDKARVLPVTVAARRAGALAELA
jgi:tRNA A37 threonylcarbamoyladenosine modification protein TsaB